MATLREIEAQVEAFAAQLQTHDDVLNAARAIARALDRLKQKGDKPRLSVTIPFPGMEATFVYPGKRGRAQTARKPSHTETTHDADRRMNEAEIAAFNARAPIGTKVRYWAGLREGDGVEGVTRSAAYLLGGHTPVVFVTGYAACVSLTHVEVL